MDTVRNVTCVRLLPPPRASLARRRGRAGALTGLEVGQHLGLSQSLTAATPMRRNNNKKVKAPPSLQEGESASEGAGLKGEKMFSHLQKIIIIVSEQ